VTPETPDHRHIEIVINNRAYEAPSASMTGREIKQLANAPIEYLLFRVVGAPDQAPGGNDEQVADDQRIDLKPGTRFRVVNAATFGGQIELPPLLSRHIRQLERNGFQVDIEVNLTNPSQFLVILKPYALPPGWNRATTPLMVMTDVSYPNSRMDMFWVEPGLALASGAIPKSGDAIEIYNNKSWQRFSWHTKTWTVGLDDLISYLQTIDLRLKELV
jgi:hypothetical protein